MLKIITLIGARPQIIKAAAISRMIRNKFYSKINEIIVHSGQHYDTNMSDVFFEEMEIPKEKYNLKAGGGTHAEQTAKIMIEFEKVILLELPDIILLYGDTNSTLAAALVGSKANIPIVHVEGGVRINSKSYPEEINRILTDNLSSLIFVPNKDGISCLKKEGFEVGHDLKGTIDKAKVVFCGDIMLDNSIYFSKKTNATFLKKLMLSNTKFILLTMHRHNLSEDSNLLKNVFDALSKIITESNYKIVFPVHPRTKKIIETFQLNDILTNNILFIDPVSYLEMIELESSCELIITDSGGVQKESYFFKKPCLILLENTPWIELIEGGTSKLCGYNSNRIFDNYIDLISKKEKLEYPVLYGDGNASEIILNEILNSFNSLN